MKVDSGRRTLDSCRTQIMCKDRGCYSLLNLEPKPERKRLPVNYFKGAFTCLWRCIFRAVWCEVQLMPWIHRDSAVYYINQSCRSWAVQNSFTASSIMLTFEFDINIDFYCVSQGFAESHVGRTGQSRGTYVQLLRAGELRRREPGADWSFCRNEHLESHQILLWSGAV